jgi:hypothetical protein
MCLYLGDHDPSGLNISEVAKEKIEFHARRKINWHRVAVTHDQFKQLCEDELVSPFPVKDNDPNAYNYVRKYGDQCVEVDAIPSDQVREMLDKAILEHIDQDAWNKSVDLEQQEWSQCEAEIQAVKTKLEESDE